MPPGKNPKLTDAQVAILRDWIDAGAPGEATATAHRRRPLELLGVPAAERAADPGGPAGRRKSATRSTASCSPGSRPTGLSFSPEASRLTLVRRLYFDLWGLPPSPEQTDAFLADDRPDAWERLIDSLLASPHYGERWGRHWLDLAGYADSEGILDADYERSAAWRYRDYVIRSFNADTPYDRFLQLQIAGDEVDRLPVGVPDEEAARPRGSRGTGRHRVPALRLRHEPARLRQHQERTGILLPDARRHDEDRGVVHDGADPPVRQVPLAQVRPDHAGGVLPASRRSS